MARIQPTKTIFTPLPTENEDGTPRYLLAKIQGRIENSTYPGATDKKVLNVEFSIMEPELQDRKTWKSYGLSISGPKAKRVSHLTYLILAADPTQTRESLEGGYETEELNGKLVKIRIENVTKTSGEPGQKVIEAIAAKGRKPKAEKAEKSSEKGIEY